MGFLERVEELEANKSTGKEELWVEARLLDQLYFYFRLKQEIKNVVDAAEFVAFGADVSFNAQGGSEWPELQNALEALDAKAEDYKVS